MSTKDEARASLIHMLFDQMPEDWDENDIGIMADVIEEWQTSSQPVQVEVADDMVERAERRIRSMLLNLDDGEDNAFRIATAALVAALGGGDHA